MGQKIMSKALSEGAEIRAGSGFIKRDFCAPAGKPWLAGVSLAALLAGGILAIAPGAARAQTCTFINTDDAGPGSFRQCLIDSRTGPVTMDGAGAPANITLETTVEGRASASGLTIGTDGRAFTLRNAPSLIGPLLRLHPGATAFFTLGDNVAIEVTGPHIGIEAPRMSVSLPTRLTLAGRVNVDGDGGIGMQFIDGKGDLMLAGDAAINVTGQDAVGLRYARSGPGGMFLIGNLTVAEDASIVATGAGAFGIDAEFGGVGSDSRVEIAGRVEAHGDAATAMRLYQIYGASPPTEEPGGLVVTGTVTASGNEARAVDLTYGGRVTIAAGGEVSASGADGAAIDTDDLDLVLAGRIAGTDGADAIRMGPRNNRLELHSGYEIIGDLVQTGTPGPMGGVLAFGGDTDATFDLGLLGTTFDAFKQLEMVGPSVWTLTGNASGLTKPTAVNAGRLVVTGVIDGGAAIEAGAVLDGANRIDGAVESRGGRLVVGGGGATTLAVGSLDLWTGSTLEFDLNTAGVAGGDNDLIVVTGDLDIMETVTVDIVEGAAFGHGVYTLINYGNRVGEEHATILFGAVPDEYIYNAHLGPYDAGPGALTVTVSGGGIGDLQFWDGTNTAPGGALFGRGGDGVWAAAGSNWTDADGTANTGWNGEFAVFAGDAGTVTVMGAHDFTGMQFRSGGYDLVAGAGGALQGATGRLAIGVAPSQTARIEVPIDAPGKLVKTEDGQLVLAGDVHAVRGIEVAGGELVLAPGTVFSSDLDHVVTALDGGTFVVANGATIGEWAASRPGDAAVHSTGGEIRVDQGGQISGADRAVRLFGPQAVLHNAGVVSVNSTGQSVHITDGGQVVNAGEIRGSNDFFALDDNGIRAMNGGSLVNESGGWIGGHIFAIRADSGAFHIDNAGVITGSTYSQRSIIWLADGSTTLNRAGGEMIAGHA